MSTMAVHEGLQLAEAPPAWLGEPPPEPLDEGELSWIWAGQRYPAGALSLVDGRPLRVVNPGRPGGGSGPDYLDAVLDIGGRRVRGDVELHVRASGFRAHGHDRDTAYDGVALHVVFRADDGAATRLSSGRLAPVAAFAPWLEGRTSELQGWLSAEAGWREPCRDAQARLGEQGVRAVLHDAGLRRFEAKVVALRAAAQAAGEREALWRALLDQTGSGGDREGFRRLALAFPEGLAARVIAGMARREAEQALSVALCYVAGAGTGDFAGLPRQLRPAIGGGGRPANRPAVRLAGVAGLYARCEGDLAGHARSSVAAAGSVRELTGAWQVTADGKTAIGPDRAREIVLNVVLPFAATSPGLGEKAAELAAGVRAAPVYGKTAFLERNLVTGADGRPVRTAMEQQGLLAYLGEWCSQGGCGRCPLS